ncbi:MAG: hypothetical protein U9N85_09075 [Bacteroidota bacterium]|nr:hypothetical protein [Bacteroidota bacterium]
MRTYLRKFLLFIAFTSVGLGVYSQDFDSLYGEEDNKKDSVKLSDKIFFGGNVSLSFGSTFYFSVTPEIGYKFLPRVHGGLGAYYMYSSSNVYDYSFSVYGGKAFVRPYIYKKFFLQGEYEMMNTPQWDSMYGYTDERIYVPGLLGGVGYMEQSGGRFGFYIVLLYNFIISDQTPYSNPVIRTGFVF